MNPPDLLVLCTSAFVTVFLLLAFLALVIRGLMVVYPEREGVGGIDPATLAAVTAAATFAFPGTKVTHVEEVR